ncbi:UDP-glucuronosyl/UDP-glucosyltransferase [Parasponia andersonii]|uniref:UDP-glucuronosyl/UDP-glucosyltransferase n=1 Tax=Parasponia andersonii TaxID=3476 RepID=A0A2P5D6M9_PARAD|nr:UDP-glucuronosyl/UDP-glucosyltransferase [Parasponia andersonii]
MNTGIKPEKPRKQHEARKETRSPSMALSSSISFSLTYPEVPALSLALTPKSLLVPISEARSFILLCSSLSNVAELMWSIPGDPIRQEALFKCVFGAIEAAVKISNWLPYNSFYELDPSACDLIPNLLLLLGPLLSSRFPGRSAGSLCKEDLTCLSWLDKQPDKSVIYVAFGSITILNQHQVDELVALALELTGQPFLLGCEVRPHQWLHHQILGSILRKSDGSRKDNYIGTSGKGFGSPFHCLFLKPLWLGLNHRRHNCAAELAEIGHPSTLTKIPTRLLPTRTKRYGEERGVASDVLSNLPEDSALGHLGSAGSENLDGGEPEGSDAVVLFAPALCTKLGDDQGPWWRAIGRRRVRGVEWRGVDGVAEGRSGGGLGRSTMGSNDPTAEEGPARSTLLVMTMMTDQRSET